MKKLTKVICLVAVCCCVCLVACGQKDSKGSKGQPKNKSVAFTKDVAGIDVSRYQGNVNWEKVKKTLPKGSFVYVKCTEGATYIDPKCKTLAKGAKASGYRVGGYHFFRMSSSAHEQFRHFKKILDAIGPDLIPMVDVELDVDLNGASQKKIHRAQDSLQVLLNLLEKAYGVKPIIYGTQRSYNTYCAPRFNHYTLYIGRYSENKPVINGPSHYTIWQFTENGRIDGIEKPVDFCRFHPEKSMKDILLPKKKK